MMLRPRTAVRASHASALFRAPLPGKPLAAIAGALREMRAATGGETGMNGRRGLGVEAVERPATGRPLYKAEWQSAAIGGAACCREAAVGVNFAAS